MSNAGELLTCIRSADLRNIKRKLKMFRKLRFLLPLLAILALQGPAIAQTKAGVPQAPDACVVPDFSVTTYVGAVDTKNLGLDCKARIYALAYFGKVAKTMESDAREAGSGEWTKDGGKMAREMADLAAKSSAVKAGVDAIVSGVKASGKYIDGESAKAVTTASLGFVSKSTTYIKNVMCTSGKCSTKNIEIAELVADTFKTIQETIGCSERKADKCAAGIKSGLKLGKSFNKFFYGGEKEKDTLLNQWADFSADAVGTGSAFAEAFASKDRGGFISASGMLIETSLKTYAGTYWRDAEKLPSGFENLLEIVGQGASSWLSCKGAAVSLAAPQKPGETMAAGAECVGNVTDYLNTRIAETMSYSVALYKASQEQYKSKVIQGALVTLAERFKYNDQNSAFNANGLATGGGSIFSPTKEMNSSAFVYKVCSPEKYNVDYTGLAGWHASTYDGFSGDVLRMITPYLAAINAEYKAIETKQQLVTLYSGIKFYKNANATLIAPSKPIWDRKFDEYGFFMKAETIGAVDQVALQAVSASGDVLVSTPMDMKRFDDKTGITSWEVNLTKLKSWLALVDGSYNLRVGLLEADSRKPAFSNIVQVQIKSIASNPLPANQGATEIHMLSPDLTLRPGGMLTVRAEVAKSNGAAPILYVIDKAGNGVIGAAFNLKVSSANGVEQWQYQKADTSLAPGTYTLIAKATGPGNKNVESGSIRLVVEASTPAQTPTVPSLIPVSQPAALSLNMLDFLPRDLTAGQLVKFVVQTNTRAKSASLMFDQLQGGPKVDMSNPTGNGIDWEYEQKVMVAGQPANNFQRPVWAVATGMDGKATAPMGPRPLVVKVATQQAPVTQPVQPAALSLNMLDFLPRELTAGQLVKFVVQTNTRAKSASLMFDQLQGGPKVDMSNPTGNGIDWEYEQKVTVAGQPANNFQRPVWAVATGMDGKATAPMGPRPLVVKVATQQAPVTQPVQPAALSLNMLDFLPRDLTAGQLVKFVVQTNTRAKSASLMFDQLQGGPKVDMSNPTGNGIDWEYEQKVMVAGQPANNFQRPVWAVATGMDGKATAPMGPRPLVVKVATQQAPVTQPVQPAALSLNMLDFLPRELTAGQLVKFVVQTNTRAKSASLMFDQLQGGPRST
jgi:hypothetical protein